MSAPSPLTVVHVISGLSQGGAEAMLEKLLVTARRLNPEVQQRVISLGSLGDVGPRLLAEGFDVTALGFNARTPNPFRLHSLRRILQSVPAPVVVQTWMYHADLLGGLAARAAGIDAIAWNVRQSRVSPRDIGRGTYAILRASAVVSRWVPKAIVTNAPAALLAHAACGYARERFVVIPNGFDTSMMRRDPEARARLRRGWRVDDDAPLIGLVARLDPQKDQGNFVRMSALVAQKHPESRFLLVGRGIPDDGPLGRLLDELGLRSRFILEGQRHDVAAVMSSLDVFCLSSRGEGFPNVLGEAMACETPSVTTDCGDAKSLVGDTALIAPIEDPAALAGCVERVLSLDRDARALLGLAQRRRVEEGFDITAVWRRYHALYLSLAGQARSGPPCAA